MITEPGIDVSAYVPAWREWDVKFALVKATEALDYDEPSFDANWAELAKLPWIQRNAYHVGHPQQDPAQQAAFFTRVVRAAGLRKGDMFVLDLEPLIVNSFSPVDVSFWAYVFCHEINAMNPGHRVLVYADSDLISRGYCAKLSSWGLWIADWGVPSPLVPLPWRTWRFWQFAGSENVDHDVWNGTEAELVAWSSTSG
jgi:lysozyme